MQRVTISSAAASRIPCRAVRRVCVHECAVNGNMNRVRDTKVKTKMLLSNWNSSLVYIQDGDVWKVRVK